MPLYKLTEKRMKKRAREDEDGITEIKAKMREMGEDVDDSEGEGWSESDSEEDGDEEEEEEDDDEDDGSEDGGSEEEDGDLEVDIDGLESDSGDDEDEGEEDEDMDDASSSSSAFPISLESALTEPIYQSPIHPDEQVCVLCPDKALKNAEMIKVHLESKGHKRSSKRYAKRLTTNPPKVGTDPREVVEEILADLDAGELDEKPKIKVDRKEIPKGKDEQKKIDSGEESKKRKRSRKERQIEKARKLISEQSVETTKAELVGKEGGDGQGEGELKESGKLNRKARRLLALQNGEIKQKSTK